MSGTAKTPASDSTPAPAPDSAAKPASAADGAAPAGDDESFLPDATKSEAKPEGEAKDKSDAKPDGEADDFLAETDDDDAEKDADSPADAKKDGEPEAYQPFTLPDGVQLDEAALAKATPVFRKLNLDQDGAQELVSLQADIMQGAVQSYHDTLAEGHAKTLKEWGAATKAHPEFGGKNLTESKALAAKALSLEPGARAELVKYGLDRNPHVFALLARIGSKLSDDSLVREDAGATDKTAPMRKADVMYS